MEGTEKMIEAQVQESQPQIYSIKAVTVPEAPLVVFSRIAPTRHFSPGKAKHEVMAWFEELHPTPNVNRARLSGSAKPLTFGDQTDRGSEHSCVIKRTTEYKYVSQIDSVHQLVLNADGPALPNLGFQILKTKPESAETPPQLS